jgi:hypothetical protein
VVAAATYRKREVEDEDEEAVHESAGPGAGGRRRMDNPYHTQTSSPPARPPAAADVPRPAPPAPGATPPPLARASRAEPSRAVEREGHTERGRGSCLAGCCRGSRSVPVRCGDAVAEAWPFIGSTALRAGASAVRRSGTGGGSIDPPRPRRHAARNSANKRN